MNGPPRRFRPGWKMTLFTGLLLPLVLGLGTWQLDRAEEKRAFEEVYLDRLSALPGEADEIFPPGAQTMAAADFRRIRLTGHYEADRYFLLDNQVHQGTVGYSVVSSFVTGDGRRWLLNRGFVASDRGRTQLPEVQTPAGRLTLTGVVWPELGLMPMFEEDLWVAGWPKVVQRFEVSRLAGTLDNAVPVEIRLEAGQPGVGVAAPLELNMPAAKHTGYAVQWFGLALALSTGFVIFGFKRHD